MRLQITSVIDNKYGGFLLVEVMIAFSLMTLFVVSAVLLSTTMQKLSEQAVKELDVLETSVHGMDYYLNHLAFANTTTYSKSAYGNDTDKIGIGELALLHSDYQNAWGRDNCDPRINFDSSKLTLHSVGIDLGSGNVSTDLEVRNGFAYITADSVNTATSDFYIVDIQNPDSPHILSALNTGPGLNALEVAGHFIYAANSGSTNQLQVIDITDRNNPVLISKFKLPLPFASSTAPAAISIFYNQGKIYLGTEKWDGNEFSVIDVSNPTAPAYLGGFKTNTQINDIYVHGDLAYLADSDEHQMEVLNIKNPASIYEVTAFYPSGWQTQEGKIISYFEGQFSFGRTTGGFNNVTNPEVFLFSTSSIVQETNSHDIPGGVYGILERTPYIYIATRSPQHEFQLWDTALSKKVFEMPLNFLLRKFVCDRDSFYFATGNQKGIEVLTTH